MFCSCSCCIFSSLLKPESLLPHTHSHLMTFLPISLRTEELSEENLCTLPPPHLSTFLHATPYSLLSFLLWVNFQHPSARATSPFRLDPTLSPNRERFSKISLLSFLCFWFFHIHWMILVSVQTWCYFSHSKIIKNKDVLLTHVSLQPYPLSLVPSRVTLLKRISKFALSSYSPLSLLWSLHPAAASTNPANLLFSKSSMAFALRHQQSVLKGHLCWPLINIWRGSSCPPPLKH